jgi:hypothetical protein
MVPALQTKYCEWERTLMHALSSGASKARRLPRLLREGMTKDSITFGDQVTVEGFPIPGQLFAWLGKVTKADGTKLLPQRSSATPDWWTP